MRALDMGEEGHRREGVSIAHSPGGQNSLQTEAKGVLRRGGKDTTSRLGNCTYQAPSGLGEGKATTNPPQISMFPTKATFYKKGF